ncbi:MAG: hypothetical protein HFJ12_03790 [Bacilli bacterium]|nr:hypothetical protein [Bacilli bacterium]
MTKEPTDKIPFNYFYQLFQKEVNKGIVKTQQNEDAISYFDYFRLNKEEQTTVYDKALMEVCIHYITLGDVPIDVLPNNPLQLTDLILETEHECSYQESFLNSLPFIYQVYFENMGLGFPTLISTNDSELFPVVKVIWNNRNQIVSFESENINLLEQNKIMTKFLMMEAKNHIGPIPKLLHYIRKDI